ncbi:MAG: glycosyl hydrolase [Flavobacteriaceae bacterium CG1_02_35_72]|nr:MAG: glycosyl hydrolase [Flavobacteriaceae bacterium CG1_02_35_72]
MKTIFKITTAFLMFLTYNSQAQITFKDLNKNGIKDIYEDSSVPVEQRVQDLLSRMSLDDKVNLVVGVGMNLPGVSKAQKKDKVPGAAGNTFELTQLGIPSVVLADGPAGLRIEPVFDSVTNKKHYATAFPIATVLSSTWNTELVNAIGTAMGEEVKEYGVDVLLAPAMNIQYNPLAGRNFEYFSEDPFLSGYISAAYVNGIQSNGVGTSIKHFVANNQETNRMMVNDIVSERALREIFLRGFEITVKEANPWTIMSSYNKVNGTYTSQRGDLLNTVLRDEWGFKGMVMTDWFGGDDSVAQMNAGNDLLMPGTPKQKELILEAVKNGNLNEKVLDENVMRILNLILKSPVFIDFNYSNNPNLTAHAKIARQAAAEGIVLLKNSNTLPLSNNIKKIAAFGNGSYEFIAGGTGSGDVNEAYTISLVKGLENANYKVDEELESQYLKYIVIEKTKLPKKDFFFQLLPPLAEMPLNKTEITNKAKQTDIAFITIGRNSGEFQDRKVTDDFNLTVAELEMIKTVSEIYHQLEKKVIVILNIGNVIETASWQNLVDGILLAWQGGQEAGNALTDVVLGKVNPSGKLPVTFPIKYQDVSSAKKFPGVELPGIETEIMPGFSRGKNSEIVYEDGIYVGYRYYNSFGVKVAYPFGFGLSYTSFKYDDLKLSDTNFNQNLTVQVRVTNIGNVLGKEVAELYISAPGKSMDKPVLELKGFAKTNNLKPNESQVLQFKINAKALASFDTKRSSWVIEPGNYVLKIGSSSQNIKVSHKFTVVNEIIVEKNHKVLIPNRIINELKPTN